ncbi:MULTISPECIES: hypothetical protein [unclassified Nocardia]|uniref:hypothetical protein n=1 Tax=unclassified Nocardia TaxID=2637762 RepID=UPI001CE4831E|nr:MULTISPECIES: hypothetical protein [unclassified Nocardia]
MTDITPNMMLGLTTAQRDAADRLELTRGVDLLLHYTESTGWVASLITPNGEQRTATGDDIGPFLLTAAEIWANPIA